MTLKDFILGTSTAILIAIVFAILIMWGPYQMDPVVNQCNDGIAPSYTATGAVYGDQNGDGILSGDDCDWR